MSLYSIITENDLMVDDMPVGRFRASVTFNWTDACGDGWNDPHEAAHAEFCAVKQIGGDWLDQKCLNDWAAEWLSDAGDLDDIMTRDQSTAAEQMAALRAMYARQGVRMGVGA